MGVGFPFSPVSLIFHSTFSLSGMEMEMEMEMEMMNDDEADWSDLPFDLLSLIIDKVISSSLADIYVRFGCVCLQWRSFFFESYEQIRLSNLPVLLIPSLNLHNHSNYQKDRVVVGDYESRIKYNKYYNPKEMWLGLDHKQRYTNTRSFYSLSEKKVYDFQLQVPSYMHCRGSSHGWLVIVEEYPDGTYPVHLLNPFKSSSSHKKNKIQLPPLTSDDSIYMEVIDSSFLKKFVFSTDPSSSSSSSSSLLLSNPTTTNIDDEDFLVLGLYAENEIGFCRPGDIAWTPLPFLNRPIFDVICYNGQFWGILQNGSAFVFDISPEPKVTLVLDPHQEDSCSAGARYLVESAGDLFNVWREFIHPDGVAYSTVGFHVFKLDQTTMQWVKTNTLDGRMFFLGDNASISLSPSDYFPGSCKPNSIYFTDDYEEYYLSNPWDGPHDIGVFNVEDGSLEPHYKMESKTIMPAPIWIQPML